MIMRIVLDANVVASGLLSGKGPPGRILAYWQADRFDVVVSEPVLQEIDHILRHPRIQQQYHLPETDIGRFMVMLRRHAIVAKPVEALRVIERDDGDNRYLECARAGDASIIVSRDRHLLELGKYEDIQVLYPAGFVALLGMQRQVGE
jgi:putative PIN family toxin of toxin-antitoxin system